MNGTFPTAAMPEATVAIFCSATPISTKRSGNSFWNNSARVLSVRSAQRTTMRGSAFPASTTPCPKPSRVGAVLISAMNASAERCASGLSIFMRDFTLHRANLFEKPLSFFARRRLAVPAIIKLNFGHALAGNRVRDDERRLLVDCLLLVNRLHERRHIVSVNFKHMPIECAILLRERLKRHHVFSHPINLNIIAIHDRRQI